MSERRRTLAGALLGSALAALLFAMPAVAQEQIDPRSRDFVGTLSCMSASCHGGSAVQTVSAGAMSRRPYVHWFATASTFRDGRPSYDPRARLEHSDADPHALAAQRMQEPRFQEVLLRASQRADGSVDGAMLERCARCHDPQRTPEHPLGGSAPHEDGITRSVMRTLGGIGCESCHGAAGRWIAVHYERDTDRERLKQLGMIDTKNLLLRARQCAACHVGSADQDMNHDMIAAGHPPLRFELASYEALIPRKHWDDQPRRMAEPEYEVQLWAAGRIASAEASLALLDARARAARESPPRNATEGVPYSAAPWPELAESNCFACHQPLSATVGKLRRAAGPAASNGVPPWQTWNVALAAAVIPPRQLGIGELPPPGGSFSDAMGQLRAAMERSIEPEPSEVTRLAREARAVLAHQALVSPSGTVLDQNGAAISAASVLRGLASSKETATWERMCQEVVALVAIERSLHDQGAIGEEQHRAMRLRLGDLARALRFGEADREWPLVFTKDSALSSADIERTIVAVRRELLAAAEGTR